MNPTTTITASTNQPEALTPPSFDKQAIKKQLIKKVALESLYELAASIISTGITCLFVATTSMPILIGFTALVTACSVGVRIGSSVLSYQSLKDRNENPDDTKTFKADTLGAKLFKLFCPAFFSVNDMLTRNTVTHEAGHALAALSCYQNPKVSISIDPLSGGLTTFYPGKLTKFGSLIGAKRSLALITAAGSALAVCTATTFLITGRILQNSHPDLANYFKATGITSIAQHVLYALSALFAAFSTPGNDFVSLWKLAGIHPAISAVTMIAVPAILYGALELFYRRSSILQHV